MKRIILIFILLALGIMLFAETDSLSVFDKYQKDPSIENCKMVLEYYNNKLSQNGKDYESTLVLSYVYLNELDKKLDVLQGAKDSLAIGMQFQLANLYLSIGRYSEAITLYERINTKTPNWSCPWRHKGEALWKSNELDKAIVSLNKAIETNKDHFDAYVMLAKVYKAKSDYKQALATLEAGLQIQGQQNEESESIDTAEISALHDELIDLSKTNGSIKNNHKKK